MFETIHQHINKDYIFWFCALAGTGLLFIQFIANLLGAGHHDLHDGLDHDAGDFKWLSKQALSGFIMIFGWVGLTCEREWGLSKIAAVPIALVAGIIAFFITSFIFRMAQKLRSTGNVFKIENTIGKEATIYQRIPKDGVGKISLSLDGIMYEVDAVSGLEEDLPSFIKVHIIKKADGNTVVVVPTK